jgi:hypothetical protein
MIVDSEAELFDADPNMLLEISDQIVNGASDTAPIETPSVKVSRTATALMVHAKGEIRRAVAVLILICLLGCHS